MKKRLMALCAVLALMFVSLGVAAAPALADDEMPTVKVDVGAANGDYGDYSIDDGSVSLLKTNVVYELSGATGRQVIAENSGGQNGRYFYLRLDTVEVRGGITARDGDDFLLCIDVPKGSFNDVRTIKALALYIAGAGYLDAESLDVGPTSASAPTAAESCLCIQDTQIEVRRGTSATASCVWTGFAELSGDANVTYISAGDYAPLRVKNVGKAPAALTIKDNANLYCLHSNRDLPSNTYVDGLVVERGKLALSNDAHLEAQARPLEGGLEGEGGAAIFCGEGIEIKDSAMLEAYGAGRGISSGTNLSVSGQGARIDAYATDGYGIYLEGGMNVSDGALVVAEGRMGAFCVNGDAAISDAFLVATSETGTVFASENSEAVSFVLSNSHADLSAPEGLNVFQQDIHAVVDDSWVNVAAGNTFNADVVSGVVFIGDQGTVFGDAKISYAAEVEEGQTLTIPEGASLTLTPDTTFFNGGTIVALGTFNGDAADIECVSHCGGEATCASRAVCVVCHAEYGELDPSHHANLAHVAAKAATAAAEGNIEYWYCDACGKCFSDEAAEHEISPASTVIAKLPDTPKPVEEKTVVVERNTVSTKVTAGKAAGNRLAATGDSSAAVAVAAVILGCAFIAGAAVVGKRS